MTSLSPAKSVGNEMDEEKRPAPFEAALQELETVVKQLESGELPLEQSLELFEKGMKLSEDCRKQLEEAEMRVEMLVKRGDRVMPEPFKPGKT